MTNKNGTSATLDTIAEDLKEDQTNPREYEHMVAEDDGDDYERRQARRERDYQSIVARLDQPLDPTLVKSRKGYGSDDGTATKLRYLAHHTVTRQLNDIFGYGKWSQDVVAVHDYLEDGVAVPRAVRVQVRIHVSAPGFDSYEPMSSSGYCVVRSKKGGSPTWAAYEMALGNAEAKAFKRAASKYGRQFGLDLYGDDEAEPEELDLEQENRTSTTASTSKAEIVNGVAHCQNCNKEIKGYENRNTGKKYTTEDLVNMSKKQANGRILCLQCRQNESN